MFRTLQHLLPRARAWVTTTPVGVAGKRLRQYLEGLSGLAVDIREFVDLVYLDLFPSTTRELAAWERQFALKAVGTDAERRAKLDAAWKNTGGQSPDYIQRALHTAGFTGVFVHEWWEPPGPPYVARDPRDYVGLLLVGTYQCEGSSPWECFDTGPGEQLAAHCDDTTVSDPGYIANLDLTRRAQPPIPEDPAAWAYFLYLAGETFPDPAVVPASRVAELKELIQTLKPSQQWIVFVLAPEVEVEGFGASDFGAAPFGA